MDTLNEERKKWDNERKQLIDEHNKKLQIIFRNMILII